MTGFCKEHRRYHDTPNECNEMRHRQAVRQRDDRRKIRAGEIARAALDRHASIHAERLNGAHALAIATTAALEALREAGG